MKTFQCSLIVPEEIVFDGEIVSLIAPGGLGYLEVLADHAPLATSLTKGILKLRSAETRRQFLVSGGFMEVRKNTATILADHVEEVME